MAKGEIGDLTDRSLKSNETAQRYSLIPEPNSPLKRELKTKAKVLSSRFSGLPFRFYSVVQSRINWSRNTRA